MHFTCQKEHFVKATKYLYLVTKSDNLDFLVSLQHYTSDVRYNYINYSDNYLDYQLVIVITCILICNTHKHSGL